RKMPMQKLKSKYTHATVVCCNHQPVIYISQWAKEISPDPRVHFIRASMIHFDNLFQNLKH
uniref:Uncharacterized protein n=1 Tax=Macaca mulatta TaxID=9544 RepID=A0A5F8AFI0_MACMU